MEQSVGEKQPDGSYANRFYDSSKRNSSRPLARINSVKMDGGLFGHYDEVATNNLPETNQVDSATAARDSSFSPLSALEVLLSQITEKQDVSLNDQPCRSSLNHAKPHNQNHLMNASESKVPLAKRTIPEETLDKFLHRLISRSSSNSKPLFPGKSSYSVTAEQKTFSKIGIPESLRTPQTRLSPFFSERNNDEATVTLKNLLHIPIRAPHSTVSQNTMNRLPTRFNPSHAHSVDYPTVAALLQRNPNSMEGFPSRYMSGFVTQKTERETSGSFPCYPSFALPFSPPEHSLSFNHFQRQPSFSSASLFHDSNAGQKNMEEIQNCHINLNKLFSNQPHNSSHPLNGSLLNTGSMHQQGLNMKFVPRQPLSTSPTDGRHFWMPQPQAVQCTEKYSGEALQTNGAHRLSLADFSKQSSFYRKKNALPEQPIRGMPSFNPRYPHVATGLFPRRRPTKFSFSQNSSTERPNGLLYKLSLCFPITIPYGTIHVTKASGENFYSFTDTMLCPDEKIRRNASILFSPDSGICDAWASFLHIRAGYIFNVRAADIESIVNLFHAIMGSPLSNADLFKTPLKLVCRGLCICSSSATPSSESSNRKLETRGFFQEDIGSEQFLYLCERIRCLRDALSAVFDCSLSVSQFSTEIQESIQKFKNTLQQNTEHITPAVYLNSLFEVSTPEQLEGFSGLPIVVREYGQVENKSLEERFLNDESFVMEHQVPDVQVCELRLEHQSKKMVDPRFRHNFVLTRQMAGDENPIHWSDSRKGFHTCPDPTLDTQNSFDQDKALESKPFNEMELTKTSQAKNLYDLNFLTQNLSLHSKEDYSTLLNSGLKRTGEENNTLQASQSTSQALGNSASTNACFSSPSTCTNGVGRYQFFCNADIPLVNIAYRDAKDCLSSTHGFIYMRHLMSQKQL